MATDRKQAPYCEPSKWKGMMGSHLNPTFPRAELQESPIRQTYHREEGCSLAVICQRTEEGSLAVISWGPEQILKYMSDKVTQEWWYN